MNAFRRLPWLALLLASLALALGLAACGGDDGDGGGGGTAAEDTTTGGDEGGEKMKVGLVTDIGGLNDRGFNQLAFQGLKQAESDLGVEIRVLESKSDADYIPNLQTLAEDGFDLIISVGFLMTEATAEAAKAFPDTKFAIVDSAFDPPLDNAQGLLFKEQEAGYLVGYMAGLVTETGTVSSVGGQKIPPVDRFIAGFQKGAKDANPDVKTLNGYSQDFVAQDKCKEVALDQISKGSDVVFQVAGGCGLGALDAAKSKSVWGIGVDADQAFLGSHVLSSALKRVDVAVFKAIEGAVNDAFEAGGVTSFGLAEDGVGLGKTSPDANADAVSETEAQIEKIKAGDVEIPETVG
ncbi:MAG: BMP family ABC transporter substrate-binding protein [Actinobacteria bacterium]|nr:BMP family ABC transporter substrate-binding protein [Actinomycetota bacterium]